MDGCLPSSPLLLGDNEDDDSLIDLTELDSLVKQVTETRHSTPSTLSKYVVTLTV